MNAIALSSQVKAQNTRLCVRIAYLATSAVRYNIFVRVASTTKICFIHRLYLFHLFHSLKEAFELYRLSCHTCRSDEKLINYEFFYYYEVIQYYHLLFGLQYIYIYGDTVRQIFSRSIEWYITWTASAKKVSCLKLIGE